jgi:signal transduction histidine kinase
MKSDERAPSIDSAPTQAAGGQRFAARAAILLCTVLCAFLSFFITGAMADRSGRAELIGTAKTIAASIGFAEASALRGIPGERGMPSFVSLQRMLVRIGDATPGVRYIYLMGRRGGDVIFHMDSEPSRFSLREGSEPLAVPGEIYRDMPREILRVFATAEPLAVGPYTDKWGSFISGIVPLRDPASGRVLMVLGVDIEAANWIFSIRARQAVAVLIAVLLGLLGLITSVYLDNRRMAEEEMERARDELELRVRERTAQLRQLNEELLREIEERKQADGEMAVLRERLSRAQRMEALGKLAGGVAHDLNNILTGIVAYPDMMLMELPEESPLVEYVRLIRQSGERAAAIIRDLLTLSRRNIADRGVCDPEEAVRRYMRSPEYVALLRGFPLVRAEFIFSGSAGYVHCAEHHLHTIIMNLVKNGFEAMTGGGRLVVSIGIPSPGKRDLPPGNFVQLTVSDEGIGMEREDIGRIFEPFYTKKAMGRTSGTGLGMSVVWGIVEDHNGLIDVKSSPGAGTVIEVCLPAAPDGPPEDRDSISREDYLGHGERILVVDDQPEQRRIAAEILGSLGYRVTAAAGGEDAVESARREPPDLAVLDMIMEGGIDGLETYRRMAALRPGQRAIILSGFTESGKVREAMRLGAGAYVAKPYTMETLGVAVRRELDRKG